VYIGPILQKASGNSVEWLNMATGDIEGVPAQLRLVFTNVLKNAEEIVSARIEGEGAAKAFAKLAVFKLTVQVWNDSRTQTSEFLSS
jgi:nitrogen fixation/metabolism regulation signal transduction histidine kinase